MIFEETKLKGAFVIYPELIEDERGFFARAWCQEELKAHGLNPGLVQCSISFNKKKGTLRGMHYQGRPYEEAKLVRCTRGSIYDVIIDLRKDSVTYKQWTAVELSAENRNMLHVPEGFAHGFQTLEDDTEVLYQMSEFYHPECAGGIRWDDPAFGIGWPLEVYMISDKDQKMPYFNDNQNGTASINLITKEMQNHYSSKFDEFGPTERGVDWGKREDVLTRYEKMLQVFDNHPEKSSERPVSLLDVGCGYGGLYLYIKEKNMHINYTGIDVAENMIDFSVGNIPDANFICTSVFDFNPEEPFDYVVCNGILTQKLSASIKDMDKFTHELIRKMFMLCEKGIAFNLMTTKVNFMVNNLYYRNPVELFAYCLSDITSKIRIDHAYPLYEYTIYLYR